MTRDNIAHIEKYTDYSKAKHAPTPEILDISWTNSTAQALSAYRLACGAIRSINYNLPFIVTFIESNIIWIMPFHLFYFYNLFFQHKTVCESTRILMSP